MSNRDKVEVTVRISRHVVNSGFRPIRDIVKSLRVTGDSDAKIKNVLTRLSEGNTHRFKSGRYGITVRPLNGHTDNYLACFKEALSNH